MPIYMPVNMFVSMFMQMSMHLFIFTHARRRAVVRRWSNNARQHSHACACRAHARTHARHARTDELTTVEVWSHGAEDALQRMWAAMG